MISKTKFIVAGVATITIGTTVVVICKRKAFRNNRENVYKSLVEDSEIMETINDVEDQSKKIELQKTYMMLLSSVMAAKNLTVLRDSVDAIRKFFDDVIEYLNNQVPSNFEFNEGDEESQQDAENGARPRNRFTTSTTKTSNGRKIDWSDECSRVLKKYYPEEEEDFEEPVKSNNTQPIQEEPRNGQATVTEDYKEVETQTNVDVIESFNEIEKAEEEDAATVADIPSTTTVPNDADSDNELERTDSDKNETYSEEEDSPAADCGCADESNGSTEDATKEETGRLEDSVQEGSGVRSGDSSESTTSQDTNNTSKVVSDSQDILSRVAGALEYLFVSEDSEQTKYQRLMYEKFIDDLRDVGTIYRDAYDEYFDKLVDVVSIESDEEKLNKLSRLMSKFSREFNGKLRKARKNNFKNR